MHRFGLSTTLLLAATCSLMMTAVVCNDRVITCGSSQNVHRLSCGDGVITVQKALYGRADNQTCSEGRPQSQVINTQCSQEGTLGVIKSRCDGKTDCELNINVFRTSDPCVGTYKYLDTTFTCFPAIHFAVCENSLADLQCDVGQIIFVYGAYYGRRDMTTCSYKRPADQLENVFCSRPQRKVVDSCNGKNSCSFRVSNSMFGDPCRGTYKYLDVAYTCVYPSVTTNQPPNNS
ncbi:L-rhamnose-binding lectin SML-like [Cottoperca gobio]|uniref:L-rhamnose-binding lectin SML-like n=1 Tax=Cottoperca gobio TaxID=56716 RepID=A0A6J2Q2H2_COTGO|nr:L-rhamnose-binding lectin SML-like [Cottoperca gobio]